MTYEVKDSGERAEFQTGARRDTQIGKGRYDLIPPEPLRRLARILEAGAVKYGDRNWEKGIPLSRCVSSLKRHLDQWLMGMGDEDHIAHALANMFFLMALGERAPNDVEINDLPVHVIVEDKW